MKWTSVSHQKQILDEDLEDAYVQLCIINLMYYTILNKDVQEKYFDLLLKYFLPPIMKNILKRDGVMKLELDEFFKSIDETKKILNDEKNDNAKKHK